MNVRRCVAMYYNVTTIVFMVILTTMSASSIAPLFLAGLDLDSLLMQVPQPAFEAPHSEDTAMGSLALRLCILDSF